MRVYLSLILTLYSFLLFAQPDPSFLVGEYFIEDVSTSSGANSFRSNFVASSFTITQGNTVFERTWDGKLLSTNTFTKQFVLDFTGNEIQLNLVDTSLTCGISSVQYGPQISTLSTTYDINTDDTDLTINYIEDVFQSCNSPFDASFRLRKVPAGKAYVQDTAFEQILINEGYDTTLDHLVDISTVNTVTTLDLSSIFIESLTGLEVFTSLQTLNIIIDNDVIDFSAFQNLLVLDDLEINSTSLPNFDLFPASITKININRFIQQRLDLTRFNNLTEFTVVRGFNLNDILLPDNIINVSVLGNGSSSLNLSGLSNLETISVRDNYNLSYITLKNLNLNNLTQFEILNNSALSCIEVDDVNFFTSNFSSTITDVTALKLDCDTLTETFVPDNNFERLLIDLNLDTVMDDYVSTAAIDTVTTLDASFKFISDPRGLEAFTQLTYLDFTANSNTNLNIDALVNLQELILNFSRISDLNTQNNTALEILEVESGRLLSLDVSSNTLLKKLSVSSASMSQLDIATLVQLEELIIKSTLISTIDFANNTLLKRLILERSLIVDPDISQNLLLEDFSLHLNERPATIPNINYGSLTMLKKLSLNNIPYQQIDLLSNVNLESLSLIETDIISWSMFSVPSITDLYLSGNSFTSIDLNGNSVLENLKINRTNIAAVDLSSLPNLVILNLAENQLTAVDTSTNSLLTDLIINQNLITSIDLTQNVNLEFISALNNDLTFVNLRNNNNELLVDSFRDYGFDTFSNINFLNNDNLTCVDVSNRGYMVRNFGQNLPATINFSLDCNQTGTGQLISSELEAVLVHLQIDDVVDGSIDLSAAQDVMNLILPFGFIVSDFSGIEYFTSLTNLNAQDGRNSGNGLVLDLSANTRLENIIFEPFLSRTDYFDNLPVLKSLNVKIGQTVPIEINNPSLETLGLYGGASIPSFDFSSSISLRELSMEINRTNAFPDLSNAPNLEYFRFDNGNQTNTVSNLDFVNNTELKTLRLVGIGGNSIDLSSNLKLEDLTLIGSSVSIPNGRTFSQINFQQNTALRKLTVYNSQINSFDTSNLVNLQTLYLEDLNISNLNLSTNIDLRNLTVETRGMSTIDLTANFNMANLALVGPYTNIDFPLTTNRLVSLEVSESLLSSLPLADFNTLQTFKGDNNDFITALNLSQNNRLIRFEASDNDILDYLNLSNTILTTRFSGLSLSLNDFTNNPNLTCIQVEDAAFSNTNLTAYKDAQASYSEDCGYPRVAISSSSFEQALVSLGIDDVVDGFIDANTASLITYLDISNLNVTDLNGIENFINLITFIATDNQLTNVDLSSNLSLQNIDVSNNQITIIDIRNLINLVRINVSNNNIATILSRSTTSIDFSLSGMDDLEELYAYNNPIASIDVSTNLNLRVLDLNNTLITSLDLSNNIHLEILILFSTDLRNLDLRNGNNQLFVPNDPLDVSNQNTWSLNLLNCNNLNCVSVSDVNYMDTNFQINKESFTSFDSNCVTAGTDDLHVLEFELFPNSASTYFNINGNLNAVETIRIYNLTGQVLKIIENNFDQNIDVATFSTGTYLVHISLLDKTIVKKLIKL